MSSKESVAMDNVLLLLAIFSLAKTLFMTSLLPGIRYRLGFGLICACFVILCHSYALDQNKLAVEKALEGQAILTDVSLAVMVDLLLTLGFCWSVLHRLAGNRKGWLVRSMGIIPSLLIFPTLYYIHINLFFTFVGVNFWMLTITLAIVALLLVAGGGMLTRWLLPEIDLRLELTVLISFLLFILTICCTVFHPSAMLYSSPSTIDWSSLLVTFSLVFVLFIVGYYMPRIIKLLKSK